MKTENAVTTTKGAECRDTEDPISPIEFGRISPAIETGSNDKYQRLLGDIESFPALQVFLSMPHAEQINAVNIVEQRSKERDAARYEHLSIAENTRQELISESDEIAFEIVENDDWLLSVQSKKIEANSKTIKQNKERAKKLYSRRKLISDTEYPLAESAINEAVEAFELEEPQEPSFQKRDLEQLLILVYAREECRKSTERATKIRKEREAEEHRILEEEKMRWEIATAERHRIIKEEKNRREIASAEHAKLRAQEIQKTAHVRDIQYLVHFTPIDNLASIFERGLISRNHLDGKTHVFPDDLRCDGWLDWISLSVSFPNYKMFYPKRNELTDIRGWAVLLINPEVLWQLNCKFIFTNASSAGIRMFRDENWSSSNAFDRMFAHTEHRINIPEYYTTDPQAEVMCQDKIPLQYIQMIAAETTTMTSTLRQSTDIPVETLPKFFSWRNDFEYWRQFRLNALPCPTAKEIQF